MTCHGCGRTDAKVHASQYFAHFEYGVLKEDLAYKLNKSLPKDIAIRYLRLSKRLNSNIQSLNTRYAYIYIFTPMTATYINTINNVCHKTHTRAHLREIEKIRHDRRAIYISPNLRYIYEVDTHKTIN